MTRTMMNFTIKYNSIVTKNIIYIIYYNTHTHILNNNKYVSA